MLWWKLFFPKRRNSPNSGCLVLPHPASAISPRGGAPLGPGVVENGEMGLRVVAVCTTRGRAGLPLGGPLGKLQAARSSVLSFPGHLVWRTEESGKGKGALPTKSPRHLSSAFSIRHLSSWKLSLHQRAQRPVSAHFFLRFSQLSQ